MGPSIFPRVTSYLITHPLSGCVTPPAVRNLQLECAPSLQHHQQALFVYNLLWMHTQPLCPLCLVPVQRRFLSAGSTENNRLSGQWRREGAGGATSECCVVALGYFGAPAAAGGEGEASEGFPLADSGSSLCSNGR